MSSFTKAKPIMSACLVATAVLVYWNFGHLLTFQGLKNNRDHLDLYIQVHPYLCGALYSTIMALIITLTCPGATLVSLAGGVLFPQPYAAFYAYCGYVVGAMLSFTTIRFLLRDTCRRRFENSDRFIKFEANARENAILFLIVARYSMVFPFWLVNMMSGLVDIRPRDFAVATVLSVIPGSVVYTTAGRVLGNILERTDVADISTRDLVSEAMADPNVFWCLSGLIVCLIIAGTINRFDKKKIAAKTA